MTTEPDFSGYDANGHPMYGNTADGPQCLACLEMNGDHSDGCDNDENAEA